MDDAQRIVSSLDIQDGQPSLNGEADGIATGTVVALYDRGGVRLLDAAASRSFVDAARRLARSSPEFPVVRSIVLVSGERWRVLTMPVVDNGRVVGVLQVGRSEEGVTTALHQLVMLMAIAIPTTLLLAVAVGLFLAARALDPIDHITRTAARLSADDLSRRLDLPATDDEVGRLAATFDGMLARLDRAFQRQRQFAADASHELRTPLALLISQADLALERPRTPAEYRRVLASMRDDARRMTQLLGDLLTLARADAGDDLLVREPLDVGEVARQAVATLAPLARERGVTLQLGVTESVVVAGDQTRLTQLLVNLIDNGLTYTPRDGTVSVQVRRSAGQAFIEVADTGVGIAPEHLPHLFERFYRVDKARSRSDGGAGLGLAISRWIAEAHGGTISVTSQIGHGTTFTVSLPEAAAPPAALAPQPGAPGPDRGTRTDAPRPTRGDRSPGSRTESA